MLVTRKVYSVIIYSPSCHSKPVLISFFRWTQKKIFWRMWATKQFSVPLEDEHILWHTGIWILAYVIAIIEYGNSMNWNLMISLKCLWCISNAWNNWIIVSSMGLHSFIQECIIKRLFIKHCQLKLFNVNNKNNNNSHNNNIKCAIFYLTVTTALMRMKRTFSFSFSFIHYTVS